MSLLQNSNAIESGGYLINNSLRFQSASSQYLSRTPATTGTGAAKTWTWSGWVKRGKLGATQYFVTASSDNFTGNYTSLYFSSGDVLWFEDYQGAALRSQMITTQVFRDPSAWYHVVLAVDTTQATSTNRFKLYVNGQQVTAFSTATYYAQNQTTLIDNTSPNYMGGSLNTFDGYMAEVNFIDGQALTPSSFGTTDPTSGQWVAAKYTGTYGTNGFYLPFSNGTSTTTLGADSSGNGNNWTLTNFTRSAGASDCWMVDVPSGNGGASGTQPSSNYAVLNPLDKGSSLTVANANLNASTGATWNIVRGTIGVSSGKWYWEQTLTSGTNGLFGIAGVVSNLATNLGVSASDYGYQANGNKWNNNTSSAYGATFTTNDVIGVAFDADAGTITFYKNNTSQGVAYSSIPAGTYFPAVSMYSSTVATNLGQRSFSYTPPSGFKALCTANLPVATIKQGNKYMDATTYSGNLVGQSITNAGSFKPDLVWVKDRTTSFGNILVDSVRGVNNYLSSNLTQAETTQAGSITAFNSNGFSVGNWVAVDTNTDAYVGWQWQAGQGSTSSNTNGSITSTVSVNATAGFSVVTYTGTGTTATIGHGLGVAPSMIITKNRSGAGTAWIVYHSALGATKGIYLNTTAAAATSVGFWNNVAPTSSVFTVYGGNDSNTNGATTVAYCFAEISGFSKAFSYTGNGSADGTMVYCGFQPKYILIKANAVADWVIHDATRNPYNVADKSLYANTSGAETTSEPLDILSNGFKIRSTAGNVNNNGTTYIGIAFASNPFQNSNAF